MRAVAERGAHLPGRHTPRRAALHAGDCGARLTRGVALMLVDVNTFIGGYPFRHVPHPDPDILERVLARERVDRAWVGHLPSAFYRDPTPGNEALYNLLAAHADVLVPVPAVRPDWPKWESALAEA